MAPTHQETAPPYQRRIIREAKGHQKGEEEGVEVIIDEISRWEQKNATRGNVDLLGGPTDLVDGRCRYPFYSIDRSHFRRCFICSVLEEERQ